MNYGRSIALWLGLLILLVGGRPGTPPAPRHTPHAQLLRAAVPLDAVAEAAAPHSAIELPIRRSHAPVRAGTLALQRDDAARFRTHARFTEQRQRRFALRLARARRNIPTTYGNPPPPSRS